MKNKNYYVFLDIEGVLADNEFIKQNPKEIVDSKSVKSVNYLTNRLKEYGFNPKIVIISSLRYDMDSLQNMLFCAGLEKQELGSTVWNSRSRGWKIIKYLKQNQTPFVYNVGNNGYVNKLLPIKPFSDYVVIDDNQYNLYRYIPTDRMIRPDYYNRSLDKEMIDNFLSKQKFYEDQLEK